MTSQNTRLNHCAGSRNEPRPRPQLLSAMFPGDKDEDEQQEAYQQRAAGVENAGRELAALHKKKGGD